MTERESSSPLARGLCWVQGIYFLVTGLWPLVSIATFQQATGKKTDHLVTGREGDHWLVNTVAALIIAIALVLLLAAWRRRIPLEVVALGCTSSLALMTIDVVYVVRRTIPPVYLIDAVAEVVLLGLWCCVLWQRIGRQSLSGTTFAE